MRGGGGGGGVEGWGGWAEVARQRVQGRRVAQGPMLQRSAAHAPRGAMQRTPRPPAARSLVAPVLHALLPGLLPGQEGGPVAAAGLGGQSLDLAQQVHLRRAASTTGRWALAAARGGWRQGAAGTAAPVASSSPPRPRPLYSIHAAALAPCLARKAALLLPHKGQVAQGGLGEVVQLLCGVKGSM